MRSSGLSIYQLVPPVDPLRPDTGVLTAGLSMYARPWANRNLKHGAVGHRAHPGQRRSQAAGVQRRVPGTRDLRGAHRQPHRSPDARAHLRRARSEPAQHGLRPRRLHDLRQRHPDGDPPSARTGRSTPATTAASRLSHRFRDLRREPRPAREPGGAGHEAGRSERDDARPSCGRGDRRPSAPTASPSAPELVEFHRKFAIPFACIVFGLVGRSARHRAGAQRAVARLRGEPRRDLHLLHPAVRRAGLRRAGDHPRRGSASGCPTWSSGRSASC